MNEGVIRNRETTMHTIVRISQHAPGFPVFAHLYNADGTRTFNRSRVHVCASGATAQEAVEKLNGVFGLRKGETRTLA